MTLVAAAAAFGVATVDHHLGPIANGGTVLLRAEPTVESLPFLYHCAAAQLAKGLNVVFVVTSRGPKRLVESIEATVGPIDRKRLLVVDAYSALMGASEPAAYSLKDANSLQALADKLDQAATDHKGAVLLMDSLNVFLDRTDSDRFLAALPRVMAAARHFRFAAALFTSWSYPKDVDDALRAFDAAIALRGVEDRVVLHQTVAIDRTPWGKAGAKPTLYKVEPGAILAYIPKIVVIGPHNAGKTTFVHTVSDSASSVERMGTTVALDRGTVTLAGVKAEVFGTPGQERFDPLLPTLAGQAVGAVVLADATEPDTFPRSMQMLQKIYKRGLSVVIALNKTDQAGALPLKEAKLRLASPEGIEILPCVATDADSAREVLQALVDRILEGAP